MNAVATMPEACAGGDAFFTICLWRSGFALTDPGFSVFNPDAKLFDPFQYEVCLLLLPSHSPQMLIHLSLVWAIVLPAHAVLECSMSAKECSVGPSCAGVCSGTMTWTVSSESSRRSTGTRGSLGAAATPPARCVLGLAADRPHLVHRESGSAPSVQH